MTWHRSGECCQCGDCCEGTPPWASREDLPPDDLMLREPPVSGKCPLFEWHKGKGHCAGHGKHGYYLSGCNVWPDHPRQIASYANCSYRFTWVDD